MPRPLTDSGSAPAACFAPRRTGEVGTPAGAGCREPARPRVPAAQKGRRGRTAGLACALLLCLGVPNAALAAQTVDERIRELEEAVAAQAEIIQRQAEILQRQQRELDALKTARRRENGATAETQHAAMFLPIPEVPRQRQRAKPETQHAAMFLPIPELPRHGTTPVETQPADPTPSPEPSTSAPTAAPTQPEEPTRPEVDVEPLVERGGVLTPPGTLVLEPQFEYVTDTSDRVLIEGLSVLPAILVGNIDVRRVERDTFTFAAVARYGVTNRFDADIKIPFVYRREQTTARDLAVEATTATESTLDGSGLGDIEVAGHYQINDGLGGWPFFIGNLRVKPPTGRDPFELDTDAQGLPTELATGSGFWAFEPSLSFLMPSAPGVWFGNLRYIYNMKRDVGNGFGEIDPGDAIGSTLGLAFAINPQTSFSLGWEYQFVFETEQNGESVDGTDLRMGSGLLGMSYRLNDAVVLNLSMQGGFTEDAPDFRLLFRMPISFSL